MRLIDLAIQKYRASKRDNPEWEKSLCVYNAGWDSAGEWTCCCCGRMIGKNLMGDRPYLLAKEHSLDCKKLSEFDSDA